MDREQERRAGDKMYSSSRFLRILKSPVCMRPARARAVVWARAGGRTGLYRESCSTHRHGKLIVMINIPQI